MYINAMDFVVLLEVKFSKLFQEMKLSVYVYKHFINHKSLASKISATKVASSRVHPCSSRKVVNMDYTVHTLYLTYESCYTFIFDLFPIILIIMPFSFPLFLYTHFCSIQNPRKALLTLQRAPHICFIPNLRKTSMTLQRTPFFNNG
jgi:hypothetical protein